MTAAALRSAAGVAWAYRPTPAEELARAIEGAEHLTPRERRLLDVIHETMRDEPE